MTTSIFLGLIFKLFRLPTVAMPLKDKIWFGSFNSNRIAFYYL